MAARIPRYPFPIHVNIANFVTIKLAEDNFLLWQTQFLRFLRSQELFGFVSGEIPPPGKLQLDIEGNETEAVNPDYNDWVKTDQLVSSWISGAVSEHIMGLIIGLEKSSELDAIGKPVDEITKVFGVLEGLGSEYETFRTTIYCLKPQPDYDEAKKGAIVVDVSMVEAVHLTIEFIVMDIKGEVRIVDHLI
ncbi:hypothetical protein NL676_028710 [Syzygium grande]|nr:hypothetical protein NL676_028710 [Syzygium grande]